MNKYISRYILNHSSTFPFNNDQDGISAFPDKVSVEVSEELDEGLVCHAAVYELVLSEAPTPVLVQGSEQIPRSLA